MSVYIDDFNRPYGRLKMCHMLADTSEELNSMADRIDLKRHWIQNPDTYKEHYDICLSKKKAAILLGAIPVTLKWMAEYRMNRRSL